MSVNHVCILMIANSYVRDDPRVMPEAAALAEAGYQVTVYGAARYGSKPVQETVKGVDIISLPMISGWHPRALLRELWRLLQGRLGEVTSGEGFQNNTPLATVFFSLWCLRLGLSLSVKVVHSHDIAQLPVGWLLARLKRTRLIYDAHEDASDFYGRLGGLLEQLFMRCADAVITVGERLAKAIEARGARQVIIVGSWKDLDHYAVAPEKMDMLRCKLNLPNSLTVCYYGSLVETRYLDCLLSAVEQSPQVTLLVSGKGPLRQAFCEAAQRSPNIRWLDWIPMEELPLYTLLTDVVYDCINPQLYRQSRYVVPNKMFEAFAAGKALIAVKGVGEMGEILERIPSALLLDDVTVETLKDAFQRLQNPDTLKQLQQYSLQGRAEYNWARAKQRLYTLYGDLIR